MIILLKLPILPILPIFKYKDIIILTNIYMETENEDIGLVKINYDVFKKYLHNFTNTNTIISDNIVNKANELINNYNCFVSTYDARSLWEKKKIIANNKNKMVSNKSRPHIIYIDFSDDAKCKKEFISYLNKLTDVNKENIYNKIKTFISQVNKEIFNSLFDVLINFIKSSNNNIYIEVLYLFDDIYINENMTRFYNNYIEKHEWLPQEILIEYKLIFDEDKYDTYCQYVKIKKNTLSIIKALCIILKKISKIDIVDNIINHIFHDLNIYLNKPNFKHIIELLLDELAIIIDFIPKHIYINNINNISNSNLDTSTKFKISNIIDKYK